MLPYPYKAVRDPLSLPAGFLRHEVSFAHASTAQDAFGQPANTWTPYLTVLAGLENLSGQQIFQAEQFTSAALWRITVRWPGEGLIKSGDRVFHRGQTFTVQIVNNVQERNRVLQLTCLEIDGAS